jgi:hypothetical protein
MQRFHCAGRIWLRRTELLSYRQFNGVVWFEFSELSDPFPCSMATPSEHSA